MSTVPTMNEYEPKICETSPTMMSSGLRRSDDFHGGRFAASIVISARISSRVSFGLSSGSGRFTTITSDPPAGQRQITITTLYVRPDGSQLRALAELAGAGTLAVLEFNKLSGLNLQVIPYRGSAPALTDLVSGQTGDVGNRQLAAAIG